MGPKKIIIRGIPLLVLTAIVAFSLQAVGGGGDDAYAGVIQAVEDTQRYFGEKVTSYRTRLHSVEETQGRDLRDVTVISDVEVHQVIEDAVQHPDRLERQWWSYRIYADEPGVKYGEPECVAATLIDNATVYERRCGDDGWHESRTLEESITTPKVPEELDILSTLESVSVIVDEETVRGVAATVYEGSLDRHGIQWDYRIKVGTEDGLIRVLSAASDEQWWEKEWWDFNSVEVSVGAASDS